MPDNPFAPPTDEADLGEVVKAFMVKGILHDGPVGAGLHWATARRGRLVFRERGLQCWDWKVPYDHVERAWVEWFRSSFGNAPVLRVRTREGAEFQFGMNSRKFWRNPELPLPIEVTDEVHGSVVRQWLIRLYLIAVVAWVGWRWLG